MLSERKIIFHGGLFQEFYLSQSIQVREKINYVLQLIRTVEQVPNRFLKHLEGTDGLYEVRVEVGSNTYRVFCCFDKGNLVILFNGFQKKTQKTPKQELERALRLKDEYFATKGEKK